MQRTIQYIKKELNGLYPESEIEGFSKLIFEEVLGWNYTQQVLNRDTRLEKADFEKICQIVERLKTFEPLQYILGKTEFAGLRLKVAPGVLIPRPETEELVQWVVYESKLENPRILDVGTGSGCIALALKQKLPNSKVLATDVSTEALNIAKTNASANHLEVDFFQTDILNWEMYKWAEFDCIVSNPPYVRELEKTAMNKNVLNFEPGLALFVSDENPLIFYQRIAEFAKQHLIENGTLYFEINEELANEMKKMLLNLNFKNIDLRKDIFGKDRMLRCSK